MRKYKKSNVPKGQTRKVIITAIIEDGASWAISINKMTAERIDEFENVLIELSQDAEHYERV